MESIVIKNESTLKKRSTCNKPQVSCNSFTLIKEALELPRKGEVHDLNRDKKHINKRIKKHEEKQETSVLATHGLIVTPI